MVHCSLMALSICQKWQAGPVILTLKSAFSKGFCRKTISFLTIQDLTNLRSGPNFSGSHTSSLTATTKSFRLAALVAGVLFTKRNEN